MSFTDSMRLVPPWVPTRSGARSRAMRSAPRNSRVQDYPDGPCSRHSALEDQRQAGDGKARCQSLHFAGKARKPGGVVRIAERIDDPS